MRPGRLAALALLAGCAARTPSPAPPQPAAPAAPAAPAVAAPVPRLVPVDTLEIEGVTVERYDATFSGAAACWTYVTRGRTGPELMVAVRRRAGEVAPPPEAEALLRALLATPPDARELAPWSLRELGPGVLGRDDMIGIGAIPARVPDGIDAPASVVAIVGLIRDEWTLARATGLPRVVAMLARAHGPLPAPPWTDRDRPSVFALADGRTEPWFVASRAAFLGGVTAYLDIDGEPTLLPRPPRAAHGWYLDGTWHLRVTPDGAAALAAYLRGLSVRSWNIAALAPDDTSGATFVWEPRGGPTLVRGAGERTRPTAPLLGVVLMKVQTGAQLVNDGVVIHMSKEQREAVLEALAGGGEVPIEAPTPGMMPWQLDWVR